MECLPSALDREFAELYAEEGDQGVNPSLTTAGPNRIDVFSRSAVTSANAIRSQQSICLRRSSFMAFVLTPAPPIADWLVELIKWTKNSPNFFVGKPIILDLASLALSLPEFETLQLITILGERGIRVMGLEGVDANLLGLPLPPLLKGGRPAAARPATVELGIPPRGQDAPAGGPPARHEPNSLLLESAMRSGQSVFFPRATSPCSARSPRAPSRCRRIDPRLRRPPRTRYCGLEGQRARAHLLPKIEAELIAIDGLYRTAEDMDATLRNRSVQCWLETTSS